MPFLVPTLRRWNVFQDALASYIAHGRQSIREVCSNAGALEQD